MPLIFTLLLSRYLRLATISELRYGVSEKNITYWGCVNKVKGKTLRVCKYLMKIHFFFYRPAASYVIQRYHTGFEICWQWCDEWLLGILAPLGIICLLRRIMSTSFTHNIRLQVLLIPRHCTYLDSPLFPFAILELKFGKLCCTSRE